jgi:transcriptional regulator with XRE-family HTH domain
MTPPSSSGRRRGRPPAPIDANASKAARLGAAIRTRREDRGLTLEEFAELIEFSAAHISEVERGRTPVSEQFVAACDEVLKAGGTLLELLPSVVYERAAKRHRNQALRRRETARSNATRDTLGDEAPDSVPGPAALVARARPVEPVGRAGTGAEKPPLVSTMLSAAGIGFVARWQRLLEVFVASERVLGSRAVITAMAAELPLLRTQRKAARAETQIELLKAEARWAEFVSWLADNVGSLQSGRQWLDHAEHLAREADDRPFLAYVVMRKSQQVLEHGQDIRGAINLAEVAQRERELPRLVRALSAVREAQGHAVLRNRGACVRKLDEAHELIDRRASNRDPWWSSTGTHCTHSYVEAYEGHCWLQLHEPHRAIACFEQALESWPGIYRAEEALQRSRLAIAHAANNDADQAAVEGQRALEIHQEAPSSRALIELALLDQQLAKWPTLADVHSFHDGFATARRSFSAANAP